MFRRNLLLTVVGPVMLLAACATARQETELREDLLRRAGFVVKPADTPERRGMLRGLPPHTLVKQQRGSELVFLFADPKVCDCLYVGTEADFLRYRQEAVRRQIAYQDMLDPQLQRAAAWRWGAWDPAWIY